MSESLLKHSMFYDVFFPPTSFENDGHQSLKLRKTVYYSVLPTIKVRDIPIVVFDFETTGLDSKRDLIIEVGAQKILHGKVLDELSSFVECPIPIPDVIKRITGISDEMLQGQPSIESTMEKLLKFMDGSILVAHNAAFDVSFLKEACSKLSIDLECPAFCTVKLARELLPELERKDLDSLAQHYGLTFESRHRSIGDVKVTASVLEALLENQGRHLIHWQDFKPFMV